MNIIEKVKQESKKRKIYIWGASKTCEKFIERFQKEDIIVEGVIDSKRVGEIGGIKIITPEEFEEKKEDTFIVVSVTEQEKLRMKMEECYAGRYIYEGDGIYIQSLKNNFYGDFYDNEINGYLDDCLINLRACGKIKVGKNVKIGKNVTITVGDYSKLIIGDDVTLKDNVIIKVSGDSIAKIGDNVSLGENVKFRTLNNSVSNIKRGCRIDDESCINVTDASKLIMGSGCALKRFQDFYVFKNSEAKFGERTTLARSNMIHVLDHTKFQCGKDCMFSYKINIRTLNSHTIFTQNGIKHTKESVILGNHVWIGMECILMPGTNIGDCSIVGASTLVNKKIPPHCLVVGTPCRIMEEGVDWSRKEKIDEEYFMEEVKRREF